MKTLLKFGTAIAAGSHLATAKNPLPQDGLTQAGVQLDIEASEVQPTQSSNNFTASTFVEEQLSAAGSQLATPEALPKAVVKTTQSLDITITEDLENKPNCDDIIDHDVIKKAFLENKPNYKDGIAFLNYAIVTLKNDVKPANSLWGYGTDEFLKQIKPLTDALKLNEDEIKENGVMGAINTKVLEVFSSYGKNFTPEKQQILMSQAKVFSDTMKETYDSAQLRAIDSLGANVTAEVLTPVLWVILGAIGMRCGLNTKTRKEKITDLRKEKSKLNKQIKAKKVELKTEKANNNPTGIMSGQQRIKSTRENDLKTDIVNLRAKRTVLQDKIITAQIKVNPAKGLEEIQRQILKTDKAIEKKTKKNKTSTYLQHRLQDLKDQHEKLEKLMNPIVTRLMEINKTLTTTNQDQSNQLQTKDNQIKQLTTTNQALTNANKTLTDTIKDLTNTNKMQSAEIANLKQPQQTPLQSGKRPSISYNGSRSSRSLSERKSTESSSLSSSI